MRTDRNGPVEGQRDDVGKTMDVGRKKILE